MSKRDWGNWGGFGWTMFIPLLIMLGLVIGALIGIGYLIGKYL